MTKLFSKSRVLIALGALFAATDLLAQASRTWVSGVGDDVNPCSRTAPCKTFAGAISKTVAGGEINVLDPGGFGAVTITKAITIDGSRGSIAGVLASGTNGINVVAGSADVVTLRNLDINGLGSAVTTASPKGIRIGSAKAVHVENCVIYGFQKGISVETTVPSTLIAVRNSVLRNNSNAGLFSNPAPGGNAVLAISNSHLDQNGFSGMHLTNDTKGTVTRSTLNLNAAAGLIAESSTIDVAMTDCTISGNNYGISAGAVSAAVVRIAQCLISGNSFGVSTGNGAAVISFGNNALAGNTSGGNSPSFGIGTQ